MDFAKLRELLEPLIADLKDAGPHWRLPSICDELGLPAPVDVGSKRDRMVDALRRLPDAQLEATAALLLAKHPPPPQTRNSIQDVLWMRQGSMEIPKRYRRDVANAIDKIPLYGDARRFDDLLERLWVLDTDPLDSWFGESTNSLRAQIQRHVHNNDTDWSTDKLFDELGAYEAPGPRFAKFLEGLSSADVRPSEAQQREFVDCVNAALLPCGAELREHDIEGGYPVFRLVSLHPRTTGQAEEHHFRLGVQTRFALHRRHRQ